MDNGLHIHRSERTDTLLAGLARMLGEPPGDPFTPDVVAVPTRGIERYLAQGLGARLGTSGGNNDGVCANVSFPAPGAVVHRVIAQATGLDPATDPWQPHRMVWPLLQVIDSSSDGHLAHHLRPGHEDRRFAVAARLAALFASYASQRPDLLLEWADPPPDLAWQAELWRRLREAIGVPSPAERLAVACAAVAADPSIVDLPGRLSVFGPTRLPTDHLRVLRALADGRQVHLWLADASPAQWGALQPPETTRRRDDRSAESVRHPLVRSLGRDARELRLRLAATDSDEHLPVQLDDDTLLGGLQSGLRADTDPYEVDRMTLSPGDRSVQVHACHGQARQAEVVREVVLGLLQNEPTLEPRDILIMCPDLDAFAPLLSAAFSDRDDLRLRVADRTPEQSNEVLAAVAALLELADSRAPLSAVLDFAARPPVRERFGFDDDSLTRLEDLAAQAQVRWGLDSRTRERYLLQLPDGTWAWGLDRLLLGAAMSEDGLPVVGGVLPVDDVGSGDVELIGAFAELQVGLTTFRDAAADAHPLHHWTAVLTEAVTGMMDARGAKAWQVPNALAAITALTEHARNHAGNLELRLADLRWLLAGVLAGRPTRSNFRSGALTVCGLVPMRSVPHRVICLVGLDDGVFPRSVVPDGDDILARDPRLGERDPRSEDRQLLLDAIMAATDHLVITYTGADERSNEPRPPCVPLGELLDTLDAMAVTADGRPAREQVRTSHPLQPFDGRNFTPGALGQPGPFSHDAVSLAAARTAARPRRPAEPFLSDVPHEQPELVEVTLRDLQTFLASPPAAFLRTRVGLALRGEDEPPPERIPVALDGLAAWLLGDRALNLLLRGASAEQVRDAEVHRGALPPGELGSEALQAVGQAASTIAAQAIALRDGNPGRQLAIGIILPTGVRLTGTVPDIYGTAIVRATYSKAKAKHQLQLWPELLAAAVTDPAEQWTGRFVTKDGGASLIAPEPKRCAEILAELVGLYSAGMRAPLPLVAESGLRYAHLRVEGKPVSHATGVAKSRAWDARFGAERALPEVTTLWGSVPFEEFLEHEPGAEEDWYPHDPSRFGVLARRLWEPILAAQGAS